MNDPASVFGMDGWPFWLVVVALYVSIMARSHATYWLGRAVPAGAQLEAEKRIGPAWWLRRLDKIEASTRTPRAQRGAALVHRWGPVGVAVTYPVVGLTTAVLVAAGLVKMPYVRFTVASLFGSALWTAVWAGGLAAIWAATRSWWGIAVLAVLVVAVVGVVVMRRRGGAEPEAVPAQEVAGRSTALP
ncbi:MAG: VTT domain-containing protein [Micrococcales bacterium]|nr:VTT domain-containing protein [Micrococcales bacterium]MCL2667116.1 VTT domain-containing protein [Micrococcales bacterium]